MFDSKLEAFLKRNLDVETFEKVRTHEPCIVCSDSEDKVCLFSMIIFYLFTYIHTYVQCVLYTIKYTRTRIYNYSRFCRHSLLTIW